MDFIIEKLGDWIHLVVTVVIMVLVGLTLHLGINRRNKRYFRAVGFTIFWLVCILALISASPMEANIQSGLLSIIGIVLSAALALGSTTMVSQALAGVMLKFSDTFRTGDYVICGENEGRVTGRGIFSTDIQTKDRNTVSLPNLSLATSPVRVLDKSGTVISCEVGLGYDMAAQDVLYLFVEAIKKAGLEDPYVTIEALGDYAVTYRACGMLRDTRQYVTARSRLMGHILRTVHAAGHEIASPTLMNQRVFPLDHSFSYKPNVEFKFSDDVPRTPEKIWFDRADEAESMAMLKDELKQTNQRREDLKKQMDSIKDADEKEQLNKKFDRVEKRITWIQTRLDARK